jgi:uncharacterized protein
MAEMRQPPAIDAYGGGGFRVGGARVEGSLLILEDVARPWRPAALNQVEGLDFNPVISAGPGVVELVVLGTGAQTRPAPRLVREALQAGGFGLEVMNTPEACRLYNLLASEGRRIAAALIAI